MLSSLLAGLALSAVVPPVVTPRVESPAAFSLVLESTPTGWIAQCDSGCRWRRLSFDCARTCATVLDANGISAAGSPIDESAPFRFRLERTDRGVRATSATGTAWTVLSWSCADGNCRAHIDAYGVSGMDRLP